MTLHGNFMRYLTRQIGSSRGGVGEVRRYTKARHSNTIVDGGNLAQFKSLCCCNSGDLPDLGVAASAASRIMYNPP